MKVLMVVPGVLPFHTGGGVAEVNWAILKELRARGHRVMVMPPHDKVNPRAVADIEAIGAEVGTGWESADIQAAALAWLPDALYCYSMSALQRTHLIRGIPRMVVVGDLDHQVPLYRRQYYLRSQPITYPELAQLHNQAMLIKESVLPSLQQCEAVVCNCFHHSQWLTQMGVDNQYVPNPVADPMPDGWVRKAFPNNVWPRVSMAGHLGGIATLSGLYFLAEDMMPYWRGLECEIRIAGAEELYPDLATRLMPYMGEGGPVHLLGYVDDIQQEMMDCEVFLVTTPIDLGVRTRIIDAWALGCCVVTHTANLAGFEPGELLHGVNCLVGGTGKEIVAQIKQALASKELRMQLGQRGRETYEKHHRSAAGKTVDLIESLCRAEVMA